MENSITDLVPEPQSWGQAKEESWEQRSRRKAPSRERKEGERPGGHATVAWLGPQRASGSSTRQADSAVVTQPPRNHQLWRQLHTQGQCEQPPPSCWARWTWRPHWDLPGDPVYGHRGLAQTRRHEACDVSLHSSESDPAGFRSSKGKSTRSREGWASTIWSLLSKSCPRILWSQGSHNRKGSGSTEVWRSVPPPCLHGN